MAPAPLAVPRWEHFEHEADVGVRGVGRTVEEAFEQAGLALTAAAADPASVGTGTRVAVACEAPDLEMLLVDWLNAVVYEMATRGMLFGRFHVRIQDGALEGSLEGEPVRTRVHEPAVEVKAATYAALRVARGPDGLWVAECVVDV